jgi:hypothetical protein
MHMAGPDSAERHKAAMCACGHRASATLRDKIVASGHQSLPGDHHLVTGYGLSGSLAAVIGWFGAFCGTVVNVLIGFNLAAAAAARSPSAAAQILVSGNTAAMARVFFAGYFAGIPVATILTGIALWRSQAVPRWLPVLFAAGLITAAPAPWSSVGSALAAVCDRHGTSGAADSGHGP